MTKEVVVVIPCKEHTDTLMDLVKALNSQYDIRVVGNYPKELCAHHNVIAIPSLQNVSEARQTGMSSALGDHGNRYDYILQADADALFTPRHVEALVKIIELDPKIGMVAGVGTMFSFWNKGKSALEFTHSPANFCCLIKRELAESLRYDPMLTHREDMEYSIRAWLAGWYTLRANDVKVLHPRGNTRHHYRDMEGVVHSSGRIVLAHYKNPLVKVNSGFVIRLDLAKILGMKPTEKMSSLLARYEAMLPDVVVDPPKIREIRSGKNV